MFKSGEGTNSKMDAWVARSPISGLGTKKGDGKSIREKKGPQRQPVLPVSRALLRVSSSSLQHELF